MSAGDHVARMLTLIPWLLVRPGASLDEAAHAFGVSAATVRDDLAHLDFCGLPGLGGGALFDVTLEGDRVVVSMADELRRPLRLTPREALRLVLCLQAVGEALGDEVPALRTAIDKVRRAARVPVTSAVSIEDPFSRSPWIDLIRAALREDRTIRIQYQARADSYPRDRTVDPWQLDVTPDGWYLHGHDHEAADHRIFRLDRIAEAQLLDVAATVSPPGTPLPRPRYAPTDDAVAVDVWLGPSARWLADTIDHDELTPDRDGVRLRFSTDAPAWAARLLLMGGSDVVVHEPAEVAQLMQSTASAALARYDGELRQ